MEVQNTKKPPVELLDHFFTDVQVKADPATAKGLGKGKKFGYNYKRDLECSNIPQTDLKYQVQLTIETSELSDCLKGYDVRLVVFGVVQVDKKVDEKRRDGLAAVLGATLLYSAAREFLYAITLRGPFPPIYLPTTSFIPNISEEKPAEGGEGVVEDKPTPKSSAKPKVKKKPLKKG